jgi:hypothetical protein
MSKERKIDLLSGEACISLLNEPLDDDLGSLLNVRETALDRARRSWREANLICAERSQEDERRRV